jgi:hypothetical protein
VKKDNEDHVHDQDHEHDDGTKNQDSDEGYLIDDLDPADCYSPGFDQGPDDGCPGIIDTLEPPPPDDQS